MFDDVDQSGKIVKRVELVLFLDKPWLKPSLIIQLKERGLASPPTCRICFNIFSEPDSGGGGPSLGLAPWFPSVDPKRTSFSFLNGSSKEKETDHRKAVAWALDNLLQQHPLLLLAASFRPLSLIDLANSFDGDGEW